MGNLKNIFQVCTNGFLKWHKNIRVIIVFLLMAVFLLYTTRGARDLAMQQNMAVTPWIYPFLFGQSFNQILFYLPLIFLFCDAPFFDEQFPYVCARSKRQVWAGGQVLYIFLSALIFTAALYLFSIVFFIPNLGFSLEWGKILRMLLMGSSFSGDFANTYALGVFMSPTIFTNYTPLQATGIALLITWLNCVFLGLLMFLINMRSPRGFGAVAASLVVFFSFFASQFTNGNRAQMIYYFSPISWSDISNIQTGTELRPPLAYVICMLTAIVTALSVLAVRAMKHRDIDVLPEV